MSGTTSNGQRAAHPLDGVDPVALASVGRDHPPRRPGKPAMTSTSSVRPVSVQEEPR